MISCVEAVPARVFSLRSKLSIAPLSRLVALRTGGIGTLLSLVVIICI